MVKCLSRTFAVDFLGRLGNHLFQSDDVRENVLLRLGRPVHLTFSPILGRPILRARPRAKLGERVAIPVLLSTITASVKQCVGGEHVEVVDDGLTRLAPIIRGRASTNATVRVYQHRNINDIRIVGKDRDPVMLVGRVRVRQKLTTIEMLDSSEAKTVMAGLSFKGRRLQELLEVFCWSRRPKVASLTQPTRMKAAKDWQSTGVHYLSPFSLSIALGPQGAFSRLNTLPRAEIGKGVAVPVPLSALLARMPERFWLEHVYVRNRRPALRAIEE